MLPVQHRLPTRDLLETLHKGRKAGGRCLVVYLRVADRGSSVFGGCVGAHGSGAAFGSDGVSGLVGESGSAPMFVPLAGTEAKFAVICGKKVGKAPIRNKVRRRLREVCRLTLASSVPPASQIVIRALPGSAGSPYAKLEAEAVALVSRLTRNVVTSNG